MKLSTKLKISFAVLIIVPYVLLLLSMLGIVVVNSNILQKKYGVKGDISLLTNPVELASKVIENEYQEILEAVWQDRNILGNQEFLEKIDEQLNTKNAYLVVQKRGRYLYGYNEESRAAMERVAKVSYANNLDVGLYFGGENKLVVRVLTATNMTGVPYRAYLFVRITDEIPSTRRIVLDTMIATAVILVIISSIFIIWIRNQTIKPINRLRLATENIRQGNLDFDIEITGHDEISELCSDFDSMRLRLKENAEEKILHDKESRELISNISHDLKTPITTIKGYVEGIMDGVVDSEEKMERYIRTIYNKACDMDRLIDELSFYSQIKSDKIPYNFVVVDISEYFKDCVTELTDELETIGVGLSFDNRIVETASVVADPEKLKRVINNIINNSVKYMDKDLKLISIRLREDEEWVNIVIEDNGCGIPREDIANIFDRFYRVDASRNTEKGGSGIGLSIVRKIIEDHGGMVEASSIPGQSTKITIKLRKYIEQKPEVKKLSE